MFDVRGIQTTSKGENVTFAAIDCRAPYAFAFI